MLRHVGETESLLTWLREQCAEYELDVRGIYRRAGPSSSWPLSAADPDELEQRLAVGGHLLPLPQEPAALANVLEVSIVNFLLDRLGSVPRADIQRGTERSYPDLEVSGSAFGGGFNAVDVKVARRAVTKGRARTQSRITLYTGNTYFRWPDLHWPGTFRPFNDYASHVDLILVYTLNHDAAHRVDDLEVIVQEPWRIASKQRSSTTREYIGAVDGLEDLRAGRGDFASPEEFYDYWRKFSFKISAQVQKQFDRLLRTKQAEIDQLRRTYQRPLEEE